MGKNTNTSLRSFIIVYTYFLGIQGIAGVAVTSYSCDQKASPNTMFSITCRLTGAIVNGIQWIRPDAIQVTTCNSATNCAPLVTGYSVTSATNTENVLKIDSMGDQDGGNWTCQDGAGGDKGCEIIVQKIPTVNTFTIDKATYSAGETMKVSVDVQNYYCSKAPSFHLLHDSQRVELDGLPSTPSTTLSGSQDRSITVTEDMTGSIKLVFNCRDDMDLSNKTFTVNQESTTATTNEPTTTTATTDTKNTPLITSTGIDITSTGIDITSTGQGAVMSTGDVISTTTSTPSTTTSTTPVAATDKGLQYGGGSCIGVDLLLWIVYPIATKSKGVPVRGLQVIHIVKILMSIATLAIGIAILALGLTETVMLVVASFAIIIGLVGVAAIIFLLRKMFEWAEVHFTHLLPVGFLAFPRQSGGNPPAENNGDAAIVTPVRDVNSGKGNHGNWNQGNGNGNKNHGNGNQGNGNHGNDNQGNGNHGNRNHGNGNRNQGNRNHGNNSGNGNLGNGNQGDKNQGNVTVINETTKEPAVKSLEPNKKTNGDNDTNTGTTNQQNQRFSPIQAVSGGEGNDSQTGNENSKSKKGKKKGSKKKGSKKGKKEKTGNGKDPEEKQDGSISPPTVSMSGVEVDASKTTGTSEEQTGSYSKLTAVESPDYQKLSTTNRESL